MPHYLLAIDQGTTSSRAIIFSREGKMISMHQIDLNLFYPKEGWVEQDPEELFETTLTCCRIALKKSGLDAKSIAAVGISNQRETSILWDRRTGKPFYRAIVWQDRRTAALCKKFQSEPLATLLPSKTGLLLDPYFSATKIVWILENNPEIRQQAENGNVLFGTVDTFLLWRLTKGKSHFTDATNASRTLLFNIHNQEWDQEILKMFQIPASILPTVLDNSAHFGFIEADFLGEKIPITGMAGDQQAATVGQACFQEGMVKSTYGTGCFMLMNTGSKAILSQNQLLATVAYRLQNKVTYGLEGSIFAAGVTIKWFRDALKIIKNASETEMMAKSVKDTGGVYVIPGFTGLGAPYWDPDARGAMIGLTRNSSIEQIVRAGLEAVCYQTLDLLDAMQKDSGTKLELLRVDGGMVVNNWLLQFLSDMLQVEVDRPECIETSALGVVYLAGLHMGIYQSIEDITKLWQANARFTPNMNLKIRDQLYSEWKRAVVRVLTKDE